MLLNVKSICLIQNVAFAFRNHHYVELTKQLMKLEKLKGPIYANDIDNVHHFNAFTEKAEVVKNLAGPSKIISFKSLILFFYYRKDIKNNGIFFSLGY